MRNRFRDQGEQNKIQRENRPYIIYILFQAFSIAFFSQQIFSTTSKSNHHTLRPLHYLFSQKITYIWKGQHIQKGPPRFLLVGSIFGQVSTGLTKQPNGCLFHGFSQSGPNHQIIGRSTGRFEFGVVGLVGKTVANGAGTFSSGCFFFFFFFFFFCHNGASILGRFVFHDNLSGQCQIFFAGGCHR